jgi:hypothetical protein
LDGGSVENAIETRAKGSHLLAQQSALFFLLRAIEAAV